MIKQPTALFLNNWDRLTHFLLLLLLFFFWIIKMVIQYCRLTKPHKIWEQVILVNTEKQWSA